MRTLKPVFGVIGALIPLINFGGLIYYFIHQSGSVQQAVTDGLGPTLLGLSILVLICCIPLFINITRIIAGPRSPGSGGDRGGPDAPTHNGDGGFDADAVVARYMASRPAEAAHGLPAARPPQGGGPAKRPGFGRKGR